MRKASPGLGAAGAGDEFGDDRADHAAHRLIRSPARKIGKRGRQFQVAQGLSS